MQAQPTAQDYHARDAPIRRKRRPIITRDLSYQCLLVRRSSVRHCVAESVSSRQGGSEGSERERSVADEDSYALKRRPKQTRDVAFICIQSLVVRIVFRIDLARVASDVPLCCLCTARLSSFVVKSSGKGR